MAFSDFPGTVLGEKGVTTTAAKRESYRRERKPGTNAYENSTQTNGATMKTRITTAIIALVGLNYSATAMASPDISGGLWAVYRYVMDTDFSNADERDDETFGDIDGEALILYVDGDHKESGWFYSGEMRFGPGSFTDPFNNNTGDNFTLHKAWFGYNLTDTTSVRIGKSQVPFAWKTSNFWPGDMFQAGYGDQMDVGIKLSGDYERFDYDLAYYHADDWGERSTDTVDDNGHWGSSSTYRKVQTGVANLEYDIIPNQTLAASVQYGRLQDLTSAGETPVDPEDEVDGDHYAWALWYHGTFGPAYAKAEFIDMQRELPEDLGGAEIENSRIGLEFGYTMDKLFYYLDATWALPNTDGNNADTISAYVPGIRYSYGPGWIYLEYLYQDGFIGSTGQAGEGDFQALYVSMDAYF